MNRHYDRYMLRETTHEPDVKQASACNMFYGLGFGSRDMNEAADRQYKAIQESLGRQQGFIHHKSDSLCGLDWFWIVCCFVVAILIWIGG